MADVCPILKQKKGRTHKYYPLKFNFQIPRNWVFKSPRNWVFKSPRNWVFKSRETGFSNPEKQNPLGFGGAGFGDSVSWDSWDLGGLCLGIWGFEGAMSWDLGITKEKWRVFGGI
jgi:hypothetical protein